MRHVFYTSRSVGLSTKAFDELVITSGNANQKRGIRSWISWDGSALSQILQGPAIAVDALYRTIRGDARHSGITLMTRSDLDATPIFDAGLMRLAPYDLYMRSREVADRAGDGDTSRWPLDDFDFQI